MTKELWDRVESMIGNPDYAVAFSIWPWPDGGWMAGVALTDRDWAKEQHLSVALLAMVEQRNPDWNVYDGFTAGINAHGASAEQALTDLLRMLSL